MFTFLVKMFPPVSEVFVHFRLVIRVDGAPSTRTFPEEYNKLCRNSLCVVFALKVDFIGEIKQFLYIRRHQMRVMLIVERLWSIYICD